LDEEMKFIEITENLRTTPGEYIYHEPTKEIVMCGSFSRVKNQIRALGRGRMFADEIRNFKKIEMTKRQQKESVPGGCGGCKK
jgi:hypothetical protein